MSLHPTSPEMLVTEALLAVGATVAGVAAWRGGHGVLAGVAWAFAALVALLPLVTRLSERGQR